MSALRIVFVIAEANASGGVRTVAIYASLLARRGHEVAVVSTPPPAPSLRARVKSLLRGRGWPADPAPQPSHLDGLEVEHRVIDRRRPVTDGDVPDADVVVATWWETAEWVAALSARKGAKVHFVQGHESDLPGQPASRVAATWRLPLRRVVCSRWLLEIARERYGDPEAILVPNGVDLRQFSAPPRDRQAVPTVGLLYSEAWIKGCDVAAAAFERARRDVPGLRLVAFGSGPTSPAVPLPEGAEYVLRPSQREIPGIYSRCDAWLWPSRREGFGLPILEAMACRTPVIAAPAGAAPDLLARGGGVLLQAAHPEEMARAIVDVLSRGPDGWRRLSDEAFAVAGEHDWESSATRFEAALERARSGEAPPAGPTRT